MSDSTEITLQKMKAGQSGTVVHMLGGHGLVDRLSSLGIRPGKRITKVSSMFMRGPVTVQVNSTQIAIGFGMANKILVKTDKKQGTDEDTAGRQS